MPRVTVQDVLGIYPTTAEVLPHILTASALVDLYFGTSTYTEQQKGLLELYWAAHLVTGVQTAGGIVETRLGDTSIRYSDRQVGVGLQSSRFGETVLLLDTDKILTTSQAAVGSIITVPLLRV